jgi:tetratricopeptide (TPR) repeat protein
VLLVLVAGVVVSAGQAIQARQARDEMERKQKEAEANFKKARQAVHDQFTLVCESKLFEAPGFQSLRKELLESALKYYQEFLVERPDDPDVRVEVAAALLRLYQVDQNMHGYLNVDAMQALEKALDIVEALLEDHPATNSLYRKLAGFTRESRLLHSLIRDPEPRVQPPNWLSQAERAIALWEKFVRENPTEPGFQFDLAGIYYLTYNRQLEANLPADALANLRKAYAVQERLAREYPKVAEYRAALAQTLNELADHLLQNGPPKEIEEHCRRALALRMELARESPDVMEYQAALADSHMVLGDWLSENGNIDEAASHYGEGLKRNQQLVADFPGVPYYRAQLAFNYDCLGHLFRDANRPQQAIPHYRQALESWDKLAAASPNLVGYQVGRSYCGFNLAPLLAASGQAQEADAVYRKAFEITAHGSDGRNLRAACLILCPDTRFRDPGQAVALAREAVKEDPTDGNSWNSLGIAYYQAGNWTEALAALEESMKLVRDVSHGEVEHLPLNYFALAMVHFQLGKKELARKYYNQGAEWMKSHRALVGFPRQARDGWRQDCRVFQNQAAELLGIKVQLSGTQTGSKRQ